MTETSKPKRADGQMSGLSGELFAAAERSCQKKLGLFLRSIFFAFALFLENSPAMSQEIFLQSHCTASDRLAILEDDQQVAYLYLTKPGSQKIERDAIAYSRVPPIGPMDWDAIKKSKSTPQLLQSIASSSAVVPNPIDREFSFKWAPDGNAVALLRNGSPMAFISVEEPFGYSKAVAKSSPLANAWDQEKYESLFGPGQPDPSFNGTPGGAR
ncbi:MAG: hypothetical protein EKK49_10580 [Rhodocyclaceae bacterium]|nr:MAG: hypothetical protein EKK49_10580 [Rhodocyclaceae bacterium]